MHGLTHRHSDSRDGGQVLPLVLVLTVILGLVAAALATYVAVGLRTSRVTDGRSDRLAALDAGLRVGIERLKVDRTSCTASIEINEVTVEVACAAVTNDSRLGPFEVTATTDGRAPAVALVQAYTSSGRRCADAASEKCIVMINSWSLG